MGNEWYENELTVYIVVKNWEEILIDNGSIIANYVVSGTCTDSMQLSHLTYGLYLCT